MSSEEQADKTSTLWVFACVSVFFPRISHLQAFFSFQSQQWWLNMPRKRMRLTPSVCIWRVFNNMPQPHRRQLDTSNLHLDDICCYSMSGIPYHQTIGVEGVCENNVSHSLVTVLDVMQKCHVLRFPPWNQPCVLIEMVYHFLQDEIRGEMMPQTFYSFGIKHFLVVKNPTKGLRS